MSENTYLVGSSRSITSLTLMNLLRLPTSHWQTFVTAPPFLCATISLQVEGGRHQLEKRTKNKTVLYTSYITRLVHFNRIFWLEKRELLRAIYLSGILWLGKRRVGHYMDEERRPKSVQDKDDTSRVYSSFSLQLATLIQV